MNPRHLAPLSLIALLAAACGDGPKTGVTPDVAADTAHDEDVAADTSRPDTAPDIFGPVTGAAVLTLLDHEPVVLVGGVSADLVFEVPDDVVSLTISVLGEGDGMYALGQWRGPDETVLVTPGWIDASGQSQGICTSCNNRIALSEGDFAALAPNNPSATVLPGVHVFTAFGMRQRPSGEGSCNDGLCSFIEQFTCPADCQPAPLDGTVYVTVHAKVVEGGALPATGVLDLNLHFTGAKGWSAATAPTDPELQGLLDAVRALYAQVGVRLGEITYRDIPSSYRVIETVQGADSDLMQLFGESDGARQSGLNLFFVDELSAGALGGFGVILGVAGGIPGPPLAAGTHRSGVAISVKEVQGAPAGIDTTIAHEMGHYLGLFHTTEQSLFGLTPEMHDPLPDTPNNDETYLMFNTGAGTVLSPWQGQVMRENPLVRHEQEDL